MLGRQNGWKRAISGHSKALLVVACVALFLAMQGGAPFYHPDSLIPRAEKTLANKGNPEFFNYPALMIYLNGAVYWFHDFISKAISGESSDPWPYSDFPGQLLTAVFSLIGALSVYGTGYLLTRSKSYALAAALLLVTAPLWNADSHYITVDIPVAALCALTLFALVYVIKSKDSIKPGHIAVLGIATGLAASAKYNGAMVASSVIAALWARLGSWFHKIGIPALFVAISVVAFLIVNPFVLIEFDAFKRDFMYEANHATQGQMGFTVDTAYYHLTVSLRSGWGTLLTVLSGLGAMMLLMTRKEHLYTKLAVLIFPLLHLVVLYRTRLSFDRYALPVIPFLAILAMYAVFDLGRYARIHLVSYQSRIVNLLLILLLTTAGGMNLYQSERHNIILGRRDTRDFLQEAFKQNGHLMESRTVYAGKYARLSLRGLVDLAELRGSSKYGILIVDSFSFDRHIYDERTVPRFDFSGFSQAEVVTISPYYAEKERVPFSPKSIYSPYAPDLRFRTRPGPYIEIYFRDTSLGRHFYQFLSSKGVRVMRSEARQGYYYKRFSRTVTALH